MTPATLRFLRHLCNQVTLRAADDNFESTANALITAMHELDEALKDPQANGATSMQAVP